MPDFRFKQFSVRQDDSALKIGTDAVLLGAAMTVSPDDRRLLDIGTGTGVIALMAAQRCPDAKITAVEIDAASAGEATFNFAASPWSSRLQAICTPLQEYAPPGKFDLIFSNPPYFDNSLTNPGERETSARHTVSLSNGDICAFAAEWLTPDGRLSLILPSDCERTLLRTAASFGLYPFRILRIRTTAAKAPKRILVELCRTRAGVTENELTLQDGPGRSAAYSALTREFYL